MKANFFSGRGIFFALLMCCSLSGCISKIKALNGGTKWSKKTEARPLEVHGAFGGDHLYLHSLTVFGSLHLTNSHIDHDLTVFGFATLDNVRIGGSLRTSGLSMNNCKTKDITINSNHQTVVKIAGVTTVDGELQFSRTKGVVHLSEHTNLSGGVVNGILEEAEPISRTGPIVDGKERSEAKN